MSAHHENELLQTTCTECQSIFHLNLAQLVAADGHVRCSECNAIFDANTHLIREHNIANKPLDGLRSEQAVSLHEAMSSGDDAANKKSPTKLYYFLGILILMGVLSIQWVYFNRLQLIKNPNRQHLVLSLCSWIPCDTSNFKNTKQFKLIERNIFTHPTQANALLISGFYINEAPFSQKKPSLKISLFNLNSEVIAQRSFTPAEYSNEPAFLKTIAPGQKMRFKLEVIDPSSVTITYEFEFI